VQSGLEHLESNCTAELDQPIAEIAERAPRSLSEEELEQATERHRSISAKIDRLGPVNVLARREYEQVSERRTFLETQQQDLVDSIRNTREAIREIDTASRERFEAAFEAINDNFRRVFATLFGGGIGELRLSDPMDADASGIDIVAQPPGKRLQNVALLSGGEKSLTVMALLLATFRYQPSPFCVLDEVDSQLDEANTIRLRGLIQEMAPETQFIVITHSKTMMEVAETLYGVTMGEAGVSKLVSVRMADSRIAEMPQAATASQTAVVA
jgi:chromosome segregation protein